MKKKPFYLAPESEVIRFSGPLLTGDVPLSYDPNPNDDDDDWGAKKNVWDDLKEEIDDSKVYQKTYSPWE